MKKAIAAAALILFGAAVSAAVPARAGAAVRASVSAYDFSRAGDLEFSAYGAEKLLENDLHIAIGETERAYLSACSSFRLRYSETVGAANVDADFNEETGALSVTAHPYSYAAKNGETVTWTPADLNGDALSASNGYTWTNPSVTNSDGDYVRAGYETEFFVDRETVNEVLNETYHAAAAASQKLAEEQTRYEEAQKAYADALAEYEAYLHAKEQYAADTAAYEAYLREYNIWKSADDAYRKYQQEYAQYLAERKAYEEYDSVLAAYGVAYQKYQDYLAACEKYERDCEEYRKKFDSGDAQTVVKQISYLDFLLTPAYVAGKSSPRTLYGAITGSAVTQVLKERDTLIKQLGVPEKVIVLAENATYNLRNDILPEFVWRSTREEKYMYYLSYYEKLRDNLVDLLRALDYLYHDPKTCSGVRNAIRSKNAQPEFEILLAQLYYICNLLVDGDIPNYNRLNNPIPGSTRYNFDENYRIYHDKKTMLDPAQILAGVDVPADENHAAPLTNGFSFPAEPTAPKPVDNPGAPPQQPRLPAEPERVAPPGAAPKEVKHPVLPAETAEPELPEPYAPTQWETELSAAYRGGTLSEREPLAQGVTVKIRTEVIRYFRNAKVILVRFYLHEGDAEPAYETEISRGDYADASSLHPEKDRTGYTCTFEYWADADGNKVDLTQKIFSEDGILELYPHFRETANPYRVVWIIDGQNVLSDCLYGERPVYPGTPVKAAQGGREYRFTGWRKQGGGYFEANRPLDVMTTETVRYEAVFEESLIVTWVINGTRLTAPVWRGDVPAYEGTPEIGYNHLYRFVFLGWDRPLVPATEDVTYTAQISRRALVGMADTPAPVTEGDGVYEANCISSAADTYTVCELFALASGKGAGVKLTFAGFSLSFAAQAVSAVAESGAQTLVANVSQTGTNCYRYGVFFFTAEEKAVVPDCAFTMRANGVFDAENSYLEREGNADAIRFELEAGRNAIVFSMRAGANYEISPQYAVNLIPSQYVEFQADAAPRARAGEAVTVTFGEFAPGKYAEAVYVVDAEGNEIPAAGNVFIMPACAVSVGVRCADYEYTIRFLAEGRVVYSQICRYGDKIQLPPADPLKPDDDEYSYTFSGWDTQPDICTGDADFHAQFTRKDRPPRETYGASKLYRILLAIEIGGPIAVVALAGGITAFVLLRRRRRAVKNASAGDGEVSSAEEKTVQSEESVGNERENFPEKENINGEQDE